MAKRQADSNKDLLQPPPLPEAPVREEAQQPSPAADINNFVAKQVVPVAGARALRLLDRAFPSRIEPGPYLWGFWASFFRDDIVYWCDSPTGDELSRDDAVASLRRLIGRTADTAHLGVAFQVVHHTAETKSRRPHLSQFNPYTALLTEVERERLVELFVDASGGRLENHPVSTRSALEAVHTGSLAEVLISIALLRTPSLSSAVEPIYRQRVREKKTHHTEAEPATTVLPERDPLATVQALTAKLLPQAAESDLDAFRWAVRNANELEASERPGFIDDANQLLKGLRSTLFVQVEGEWRQVLELTLKNGSVQFTVTGGTYGIKNPTQFR